jgi:hypothetical protein
LFARLRSEIPRAVSLNPSHVDARTSDQVPQGSDATATVAVQSSSYIPRGENQSVQRTLSISAGSLNLWMFKICARRHGGCWFMLRLNNYAQTSPSGRLLQAGDGLQGDASLTSSSKSLTEPRQWAQCPVSLASRCCVRDVGRATASRRCSVSRACGDTHANWIFSCLIKASPNGFHANAALAWKFPNPQSIELIFLG